MSHPLYVNEKESDLEGMKAFLSPCLMECLVLLHLPIFIILCNMDAVCVLCVNWCFLEILHNLSSSIFKCMMLALLQIIA